MCYRFSPTTNILGDLDTTQTFAAISGTGWTGPVTAGNTYSFNITLVDVFGNALGNNANANVSVLYYSGYTKPAEDAIT
jgi:hypothetical protein